MEELLVDYYRNVSQKAHESQNHLEMLEQELEFGRLDQVQKLLKEPQFTIIDDHIFFSKAILILKKFKKEDICENLLRNEILNLEKSIQNEEKKQLFFEYCEEYFLDTLIKLKDANYIRNELNMIKNEEIRNLFRQKLDAKLSNIALEKHKEIKEKKQDSDLKKEVPGEGKRRLPSKRMWLLLVFLILLLGSFKFRNHLKLQNLSKAFKLIFGF